MVDHAVDPVGGVVDHHVDASHHVVLPAALLEAERLKLGRDGRSLGASLDLLVVAHLSLADHGGGDIGRGDGRAAQREGDGEGAGAAPRVAHRLASHVHGRGPAEDLVHGLLVAVADVELHLVHLVSLAVDLLPAAEALGVEVVADGGGFVAAGGGHHVLAALVGIGRHEEAARGRGDDGAAHGDTDTVGGLGDGLGRGERGGGRREGRGSEGTGGERGGGLGHLLGGIGALGHRLGGDDGAGNAGGHGRHADNIGTGKTVSLHVSGRQSRRPGRGAIAIIGTGIGVSFYPPASVPRVSTTGRRGSNRGLDATFGSTDTASRFVGYGRDAHLSIVTRVRSIGSGYRPGSEAFFCYVEIRGDHPIGDRQSDLSQPAQDPFTGNQSDSGLFF